MPAVAIAPLLVLWFGYEMTPKVILIVITTFFSHNGGAAHRIQGSGPGCCEPVKGHGSGPVPDIPLYQAAGSHGPVFSSLRISASYAVVGAVISEWLGGFGGLGVYMTRVKKAFSFDKMFAVIFLISAISLILMWAVELLQKKCMPWENSRKT